MKNTFTLLVLFFISYISNAQNVGVGVPIPTEKLHVDSNIKIGQVIWNSTKSHLLKFGDGDFAHIGEVGDDSIELKARHFNFITPYGPSTRITINGDLKINDGNQAAGKVLTSDANGVASWQSGNGNFAIPFKGTNSFNQIISSGSLTVLSLNTEEYDFGNTFSGNTFTAPSAGVYHFDACVYWSLVSAASSFHVSVSLYRSGNLEHGSETLIPASSAGSRSLHLSTDIYLNAGETVQLRVFQGSGVNQTIICNNGIGKFSFFNGRRVY